MPKEPVAIEIVQEGDERFIVKTYDDGSAERVPIVKLPRKPARWPYRKVSFDKSSQKGNLVSKLSCAQRRVSAFDAISRPGGPQPLNLFVSLRRSFRLSF